MMMHPEKKVVFTCNNCTDNEAKEPQCVKWCPEEALYFVNAQQLAQKYRQKAVKKLFQDMAKPTSPTPVQAPAAAPKAEAPATQVATTPAKDAPVKN
jgi:Fe-S-cluster-containing dehydrogenase component